MNSIIKVLKEFGLSDNEAVVYIECLRHDVLSPFQIAKATAIPRTTVYDILMGLSLKGLVELEQSTGFEKQQTKVRSKNPSVLRKILQQRREDTYKVEVDISEVLPELKGMFHKDEANADFRFFPGIEGAKKVYFSMEASGDVNIPEDYWTYLMPLDVFGSENINKDVAEGTKIRKKLGAKSRDLIPLNAWTKHVLTYQYSLDPDYLKTRDFRYIEGSIFECFQDIMIKGDYIKITCTEEDEVWGLSIKSTALSKTFRSIYNLTWQMATPITEEMVKAWGENGFLKMQQLKRKKKKVV